MPWNTGLQGTHLNIAAYVGTPLRVVAGPGTGKTFALMRRVARLLEEGAQPNRILAVTFTRTAANDLVEKLAVLGVPGADIVTAKTLHSLSFGLLGRNSVFQALGRTARPLMDYEMDTLFCDLQQQFGGKRAVDKLIKAFEAYWARLQHQQPAHPEGIVEYPQTHANTHDELLNECRRCPRRVVQIANALINHNLRLAPKPLNPFPQNGDGEVYIVQHNTVAEEIDTLAAHIEWHLENHPGMPAGEVLVLASRRMIGNGIRDALNLRAQQNNRPWSAQSFYFEDALSTALAAGGFSLLTLLIDPEDRPALRYWLGAGQQDCRSRPYARLGVHCAQTGQSPRMALEAIIAGNLQLPYTQSLVARYTQLQQRLAGLMPLGIPQLLDTLFPDGNADVATVRQAALLIAPNVQTPRELLNELRTDIVQPELPGTQGPAVRIMSLHKSKGLTARLVVIAGCVAGILPSIDFTAPLMEQNRQRQEQRRLFYVGLTRSTQTLVLSSAVHMPYGTAMQMRMPVMPGGYGVAILQASPFLAELGAEAPDAVDENTWRANVGF